MLENWKKIPEFENYAVSNLGNVLSMDKDLIMKTPVNQQGIRMTRLSKNGVQHIRSVAVLVANAFVPLNDLPETFDTPIHLDGDKTNCAAVNLAWRPRWFAVKYHQQFSEWQRENRPGYKRPIQLVNTGELFPTSWEAATKYGLLDREIFINMVNGDPVFPFYFYFREYE